MQWRQNCCSSEVRISCNICRKFFFSVSLRFCLVGLSSARYSVANTSTSHRVHCFYDDKGPLFQCSHSQMSVIRHRLKIGAKPWPHGISHLQDSHLICPHLQE
ncbi:hypothetical protein AMECASPLE_032397 [Ameca splendens]|uniref:Secreted protein n=1 Tax=Ameca splendens TaxID=208324 RepID=A0ABV0Y783_9TELE